MRQATGGRKELFSDEKHLNSLRKRIKGILCYLMRVIKERDRGKGRERERTSERESVENK